MDPIFRTDPNSFTSDAQYWQALANSYACVESGGQKKEVQAREERKREELQLRFRQFLIFFIKIEVPVPYRIVPVVKPGAFLLNCRSISKSSIRGLLDSGTKRLSWDNK